MPHFWRNLWRVLGSLTDPPKRSENNTTLVIHKSRLSLLTHRSLRSERTSRRRFRFAHPSVSRHVVFSPSTLDHQKNRNVVMKAETSAFQNFVREVYEGYYDLLLYEERMRLGLQPEEQLTNRRLGFQDLVRLQKVASDMWRKMSRDRKQHYKDLARMALHRRSLRLPPDPYRLPPHVMRSSKKLKITRSIFVRGIAERTC
ncbi:uncharacterized protein LOC108104670 [Drosophila eugracilis]|uniref:uncharacterized protein LOC108104670 n=1 Tax=Drosophila eugracilis TaxID=29029 RepID=UPI0007E63E99|nr:uncharacterized protein LOC108104670 [Drosophila eugracilis]